MAAPTDAECEAYWLALGRFIHFFAELELRIKLLLSVYVGAKDGMIQPVWSGTRADAALGLIKRVQEAHGIKPPLMFTRATDQFGIINSARNIVAHFPVEQSGVGLIVSNYSKVMPGRAVRLPASADMLNAMASDCDVISAAFVSTLYEVIHGKAAPEKWRAYALAPWLYKPSPQTKKHPAQV